MSGLFSILSVDDIFKLPDVPTGIRILKEWGISTKGLKDKKSVQEALLQEWKTKEEVQGEASDEVIILVLVVPHLHVFFLSLTKVA